MVNAAITTATRGGSHSGRVAIKTGVRIEWVTFKGYGTAKARR
jgi:hypothetical protein